MRRARVHPAKPRVEGTLARESNPVKKPRRATLHLRRPEGFSTCRFVHLRGFRGRFRTGGDKSISHRLALFGGMARGTTEVSNYSSAADCASTLACLSALGVRVEHNGDHVAMQSDGIDGWRRPAGLLDAGNSGSTVRMLAGALAGRPFRSEITGDESLSRRPMERVAVPLRAMGARLDSADGHLPLVVHGGDLSAVDWNLSVASAQVKTAVLLAGIQARGTTSVTEPEASRDHTERLLPAFGVPVRRNGLTAAVEGGSRLSGGGRFSVPGDISSAAFLIVAGLLARDGEVRVEGVSLNPGRTAFLDVLREMGADLEICITAAEPEPVGTIIARPSRLVGTSVRGPRVPALVDEVPILAVAGAMAEGTFVVEGATELRVKESDRIAALVGRAHPHGMPQSRSDRMGFAIQGGQRLRGATVRSFADHRIAMALAVAGLSAEAQPRSKAATAWPCRSPTSSSG